jgi:hypothetical protein
MIELKLHRAIYDGRAVDEAVKRFAPHAQFTLREEPEHWVVALEAEGAARARQIAGELGNYALGLTVHGRGHS